MMLPPEHPAWRQDPDSVGYPLNRDAMDFLWRRIDANGFITLADIASTTVGLDWLRAKGILKR